MPEKKKTITKTNNVFGTKKLRGVEGMGSF